MPTVGRAIEEHSQLDMMQRDPSVERSVVFLPSLYCTSKITPFQPRRERSPHHPGMETPWPFLPNMGDNPTLVDCGAWWKGKIRLSKHWWKCRFPSFQRWRKCRIPLPTVDILVTLISGFNRLQLHPVLPSATSVLIPSSYVWWPLTLWTPTTMKRNNHTLTWTPCWLTPFTLKCHPIPISNVSIGIKRGEKIYFPRWFICDM